MSEKSSSSCVGVVYRKGGEGIGYVRSVCGLPTLPNSQFCFGCARELETKKEPTK